VLPDDFAVDVVEVGVVQVAHLFLGSMSETVATYRVGEGLQSGQIGGE